MFSLLIRRLCLRCELLFSGFFYCEDTCYLTDWTLSDEGRTELREERKCSFFQRNVMNKEDLTQEPDLKNVVETLFDLTAGELVTLVGDTKPSNPSKSEGASKLFLPFWFCFQTAVSQSHFLSS